MEIYLGILLVIDLLVAIIPAKIAQNKGKAFYIWYIYGAFLFFFAMIHAIVLKEEEHIKNNLITKVSVDHGKYNLANSKYVDINCPVEVSGFKIKVNENTGQAYCYISFFNMSEKVIKAVRLYIYCYDSFGKEVIYDGNNEIEAVIQDEYAKARASFGSNKGIALVNHSNTRNIDVIITEILFEDESTWKIGNYELKTLTIDKIKDNEELNSLKMVVGKDSICYPKINDDTWMCVCGRLNDLNSNKCRRCERDKEITLTKFSEKVKITGLINDIEERNELIRQQQIEEQEIKKIEKKKKNKRILVSISILILVVSSIFSAFYLIQVSIAKTEIRKTIEKAGELAEKKEYDKAISELNSINRNFYMDRFGMGSLNNEIKDKLTEYNQNKGK